MRTTQSRTCALAVAAAMLVLAAAAHAADAPAMVPVAAPASAPATAPASAPAGVPSGSPVVQGAIVADAGNTVIYRSVLPDGRVVFSDKADPRAKSVESASYAIPTAPTASAARAMQERDYWRRQAEAFDQRQRERDRQLDADRAAANAAPDYQEAYAPVIYRYRGPVPAAPYATQSIGPGGGLPAQPGAIRYGTASMPAGGFAASRP